MADSFYPTHLERVSRSFAFCIAQLEGNFRDWVSLSYLLCRILDTVEDASWPNTESQAEAYRRFQEFLDGPATGTALQAWIDSFPGGVSQGERLLLQESGECFTRFHALPERIREMIRTSILNMYRGMKFFSTERKDAAAIRLRDITDVNQYCFFVAGVVGDLLTNLLAGKSNAPVNPSQLLDGHHFGLFLQKVNLLKDQEEDERQGRFLVAPSREALLGSLKANGEGAIRYILALPIKERGYRIFCAWSLFLGLCSLRWMERSTLFGLPMMNKPPRIRTKWLLQQVRDLIDDNDGLLKLFQRSLPTFPTVRLTPASRLAPSPPLQAYKGPLEGQQFRALGMI